MANVARLGVVLGMDSAEFVKGLDNAKKQLFNFQNGLKAGAFAAFTTQLVNWADKLADTADAFDLTIGSVVKLRGALQQSGGTADDAGKLLGKFATTLDNAANAGKEAQESFKKIGIGLKDLQNLSQEELLSKTVANLAKIDDPVRRNAAAFDIFGKSIRGIDVKKLNEELQKTTHLTKEQEDGIKDAANAADIFAGAWDKLNRVTAEYLGPLAKGIAQVFEDIVDGVDRAIRALEALGTAFKNLMESIPRLPSTGAGDEYDAAFSGAIDSASGGYTRKGSQTPSPLSPTTGVPRKVTAAKDSKQDQLLKELATLKLVSKEYEAQLNEQAKGIELQTAKLFMTDNEAQIAQTLYELDRKRADEVGKLEDKKATALATGADQRVIDMLNQQIALVNQTTEAYKIQIGELVAAQQQAEQSYFGGLQMSYKKFQELAINNALTVEQAVDSVFSNMTSAIDQFVETGKFSFSSFANSVIKDLIRIAIQAQATKLFSQILGGVMGAFGGAAGGMSSATQASTYGGAAPMFSNASLSSIPKFADGGSYDGGPMIVGENGPELMLPGRSGTIIPNNQLGGMNNQPQVVYNGPYIQNMSAIDTQSATQFLAQNKHAVWSANQSASRSIPTSVR